MPRGPRPLGGGDVGGDKVPFSVATKISHFINRKVRLYTFTFQSIFHSDPICKLIICNSVVVDFVSKCFIIRKFPIEIFEIHFF